MSQFRKAVDAVSSKAFTVPSSQRSSKAKSKYDKVEPKTNSGYHMGKMMEDFDIIQRNFRFKPDEIFPRLKISLLVALMCESAYLAVDPVKESESKGAAEEAQSSAQATVSSYRTFSKKNHENVMRPYLLLDVRESEDFLKSHIITAENYPKTKLSRANYETPALIKYRNHSEYIIVIYDEDEIIAPHVTTTLIQRGYNNVHMLSGGLKVAKHCFPHSLIVSSDHLEGATAVADELTVEISPILAAQLQQMCFRYHQK